MAGGNGTANSLSLSLRARKLSPGMTHNSASRAMQFCSNVLNSTKKAFPSSSSNFVLAFLCIISFAVVTCTW